MITKEQIKEKAWSLRNGLPRDESVVFGLVLNEYFTAGANWAIEQLQAELDAITVENEGRKRAFERFVSEFDQLQAENERLREALGDAIMQLTSTVNAVDLRSIIPTAFLEGKIEQYKKALNP